MQVGDVASKLTIEEATFRDIQVSHYIWFFVIYKIGWVLHNLHAFQMLSDDAIFLILYVGEKDGTI